MTAAIQIAVAMLLDAVFGEPDWLWKKIPHPAVVVGRTIGWLEKKLNRGAPRKLAGILTVALLITAGFSVALVIRILPGSQIVETVLAAILLAQRSLADHVAQVATALRISLADGRDAVAKIVGRDTSAMDQTAIVRGAIESAAENLSDGIIAPVFWFLIAGFPGLLIYKIINTADSMIGYKSEQFAQFGWAAARLDDLLNWFPARITALLISLAHFRINTAPIILRDAPLHRSPNAGWPEAAMAVCLNISLAGPRSYEGVNKDFPLVFPEGQSDLNSGHIDRAVQAIWKTWALALLIVAILAVV
ncbi:MAG: adenosylcobinamide-phosphate synthase CbiB [Paracoccaceae bacterium]